MKLFLAMLVAVACWYGLTIVWVGVLRLPYGTIGSLATLGLATAFGLQTLRSLAR